VTALEGGVRSQLFASFVAVVFSIYGCVGGEERAAGDLGVIYVSVVEAPGACPGGLVC
jgi:hypothetical protein